MQPRFDFTMQPLVGTKQRSDFVLGEFRGALWIGVRFGEVWQPARLAHAADRKFFN